MDRHQAHERKEAHKISEEIQHHNFNGARHELQKEAQHPKEFNKIVSQINRDLKAHHQHPLSIEHDKHGHISHLHFGKHDIFDNHPHSKHPQKPAHEKPAHEKPAHEKPAHEKPAHEKPAHEKPVAEKAPKVEPTPEKADKPAPQYQFLDPAQKREAEQREKADKPAPQYQFLDPAQKREAEQREKADKPAPQYQFLDPAQKREAEERDKK